MAKPHSMRLGRLHECAVYLTLAALYSSGVGWLVLHYLFRVESELGPVPHPGEPWLLRIHGASAILFAIAFGSLLPGHVFAAWRARKNRASGSSLMAWTLLLTVSGYALYYAGDETTRGLASQVHRIVGICLPALLVWHLVGARRMRRLRKPGPERNPEASDDLTRFVAQAERQHGQSERRYRAAENGT